ncbi:MAG: Mlc titration factor MtfA (ptsG expression regulator) [Arenicella sp.]|jgi:Mlc titration factor MtfA (ptsG expression regulator)
MNSSYIIYILVGLAIGALFVFVKKAIRNSKVDTGIRTPDRAFPYQWKKILEERIEFYKGLNREERVMFEKKTHVFLLNVRIIGLETEISDLDRILIASSAVIPALRLPNWHYGRLKEVHLHPDKFPIKGTDKMARGLVGWGAMEGVLKLSKKALHEGYANQKDQRNVAIHEFIHIIDMQDGEVDGILEMAMAETDIHPWLHLVQEKMGQINAGDSTIREYGGVNRVEFLAVTGEFFFENPEKMRDEHPALYSALDSIFNPKVNEKFKYARKYDPCPCGSGKKFSKCCSKNIVDY